MMLFSKTEQFEGELWYATSLSDDASLSLICLSAESCVFALGWGGEGGEADSVGKTKVEKKIKDLKTRERGEQGMHAFCKVV